MNECTIEPRKRYYKAYAYLEKFTYNSPLIRKVISSIESIGEKAAMIDVCDDVQDSTTRAEVEDFVELYFHANATRLMEKYDVGYFKHYLFLLGRIEIWGSKITPCYSYKNLKETKDHVERYFKYMKEMILDY